MAVLCCGAASAQSTMVKAEEGKTISVPCERIDSLLSLAMSKKGCPYKWAAAGPNTFDCSGFTMWLFNQFGVSMAHGSVPQFSLGVKVPKERIRPGDLVFFRHRKCIGHVGIAISVDSATNVVTFIHASSRRTGVKIDKLTSDHYARGFAGARRIFDCGSDTFEEPVAPENAPDVTVDTATGARYETVTEWKSVTTTHYHKIKSGETLGGIAKKYHTTVANLQKWNGLGKSTLIREGKSLKIKKTEWKEVTTTRLVTPAPSAVADSAQQSVAGVPAADTTSRAAASVQASTATTAAPAAKPAPKPAPKPLYYTIKKGDTLGGIARKYHTTVAKLQKLNKMGSSTFIRDGKRLRVR